MAGRSNVWKWGKKKECCMIAYNLASKLSLPYVWWQNKEFDVDLRGGSRGRVLGVRTPPEMTCGFLINTVQSASQLYKICFIIWYVFSAVHIMLLPSRKPSSSYLLLKFVYVTSQLRHSLVVHPLLQKILDPPLDLLPRVEWLQG